MKWAGKQINKEEILKLLKGKEKEKKKDAPINEFAENPLTVYCHTIYKYIGKDFLQNPKFKDFFHKKIYNRKYEEILKKANLKLIPDEYFISIYITILGVVLFSVFSLFIFLFINPVISAFIFYGGVLLTALLGIFLYNYPVLLANTRGKEIDASMPYLLPYLKILSKEVNLSKIVDIIDDFLIYKEIKAEFKRIKYYSTFLGYDIHSSIREAMQSCPSRELSDLMNDLVTIANSGGSIYNYLDRKLSNLNEEIEAVEKKNIDTLLIYSQIYVVVLLIAPLFFTVMTAILNLIDISASNADVSAGGGSLFTIISVLFFLPFIYIGFMFLVYYSKPLYSRLKPLKNVK